MFTRKQRQKAYEQKQREQEQQMKESLEAKGLNSTEYIHRLRLQERINKKKAWEFPVNIYCECTEGLRTAIILYVFHIFFIEGNLKILRELGKWRLWLNCSQKGTWRRGVESLLYWAVRKNVMRSSCRTSCLQLHTQGERYEWLLSVTLLSLN